MIKNIIIQQKEERDMLLGLPYLKRLDDGTASDYLATNLIKLITGPRNH